MVQVTTATLTSFDVSNMDSVWTQPRPAMGYHMTAMITVMRATVHVSDPLGYGGRGTRGEGLHRIEGVAS